MARPNRSLFGPRTNEWDKGKKYPPLDPDGFDGVPERSACPDVRETLRLQKRDGMWDWLGVPPTTSPFAELRFSECRRVAITEMRRHFGLKGNDRTAATLAVLAVLTRAYERHKSVYMEAVDRALLAMSKGLGQPPDRVMDAVASICDILKRRWLEKDRQPTERNRTELQLRAEKQATFSRRFRSIQSQGLPIKKYQGQVYYRRAGVWRAVIDEQPAKSLVGVELNRMWASQERANARADIGRTKHKKKRRR